jgi:hypothetical protein
MGAVDLEVRRAGRGVDLGDRFASDSPPGSRPSVSVVNEMAAGTPAELAARTIPIASPTLVRV